MKLNTAAGSLSTTVCQLELELKSIKSSHDAISLQRMQSMLRCTEENTAAQLAALSRKAAAAQEAAESSQQQLSEAMQLHAQQMADAWATAEESQQQLTHASQAITELQQQLLDAEQMHLGQISLLQQEHAKQLAEIQACFSSRLATTGTELSEARAALCLTKDQHAKSAAQLQQQFDHAYAAEQSKHAMMLSASQAELIAARQQHVREMTAAEQQNQDQLTQALSQNSADLAQANTIYAADLAQVQTQHAADLQQAYLQYSEPQRSLQQASFQSQQSAELLSVEVQFNTVNQEHFANAVTTAGTGAQDPFSAQLQCSILAAELALLRQSLAASEKKLTHAQAEIVVHASTSVGRDEQICRLLSLQQGNMHPWKSPGHWKAVQLLIDSISTAVSKQQQADDMAAALCKQKQAENAKSAAVNRLKAEILSTMSMSESSCSTASLPRLDRHQPAEVATEAATVARDEAAGGLEPNAMSATALPQTIRSCDSPLALHNKGMPRAASPVQCCEKPLVTPVLPGYEAPVHGVKANVESGNSSWALAGNDATKAESSCVNYYPSDEDDLDDWTHEDDEADV